MKILIDVYDETGLGIQKQEVNTTSKEVNVISWTDSINPNFKTCITADFGNQINCRILLDEFSFQSLIASIKENFPDAI